MVGCERQEAALQSQAAQIGKHSMGHIWPLGFLQAVRSHLINRGELSEEQVSPPALATVWETCRG